MCVSVFEGLGDISSRTLTVGMGCLECVFVAIVVDNDVLNVSMTQIAANPARKAISNNIDRITTLR